MTHTRAWRTPALAAVVFFSFLGVAFGQAGNGQTPERRADDKWEFTIAPYAWFIGLSGDVSVRDRTVHGSASFSDIWKNLDFGGQAQVEAKKGPMGVFFQANYLKVSPTDSLSRPTRADILAGGPSVLNLDVRLTSETWIMEFGGFYRVAQWYFTQSRQMPSSFDVLAGGRYWYLENTIFASLPQFGVGFRDTRYGDVIDPIVGFRFQTYLAPRFLVNIRGDMGGFGISSNSSHFSWNAAGLLGYEITPAATVFAGYRALYIDYGESGGLGIKATIQGPAVGLAYRF